MMLEIPLDEILHIGMIAGLILVWWMWNHDPAD